MWLLFHMSYAMVCFVDVGWLHGPCNALAVRQEVKSKLSESGSSLGGCQCDPLRLQQWLSAFLML